MNDQPAKTDNALRAADARVVVVLVHGRGGTGAAIMETMRATTAADDVVSIAPTALENSWYPQGFMAQWETNEPWFTNTIEQFMTLLSQLNSDGVADEQIVLLGFSQGACVATEIALRRQRAYGAVVVLSGGFVGPPGTVWKPPLGLKGVPVFIGTSDVDDWVPLERVQVTAELFESAQAAVDFRVYEGMGHCVHQDELAAVTSIIDAIPARNGQGT